MYCQSPFFLKRTPDNAYIFGYLCADGCIHLTQNKKYKICLGSACFEGKYMQSTYKTGLIKPSTNNKHCKYSHHIYSQIMAQDLIEKGCYPRKSKNLVWPQSIPISNINLLSNFILGYFDGDGSVYFIEEI